jgi:hypothetical protein
MDSRKLRSVLMIAVFGILAWRVLSLGLADYLARDKPEQALFWRSSHPEALFRMAEISVSRKQWADARMYGLKALKANWTAGPCGSWPRSPSTKAMSGAPPNYSIKQWRWRRETCPAMPGCWSMP